MYAGGASRTSGGEAWYETRDRVGAVNDNALTVNQSTGTDIGALTDEALTIVPWDSTCGPDCRQQSEALSFIGQWSWPALQHAICCVTVAVAPSTHVAHVDVRMATTTSSDASARLQRTIANIVCRGSRRVNFVGTLPLAFPLWRTLIRVWRAEAKSSAIEHDRSGIVRMVFWRPRRN
jgi:hypothetical protein